MERRFSLSMIQATLKEPNLTLDELPAVVPEFFEQMMLRENDTIAVKIPGLEALMRFDYQGNPTSEFPTIMEMAKNLARSAGRTVGALVTGKKAVVPDEIYEQRMAACRGCDHWNAERKRCKLCGCKTNYKLSLAREKCPHPDNPRWLAWTPPEP